MTQLKTGDKAPSFKLPDQDETKRSLAEFKGKKVLIYFYPKAMTSGCAVQSVNVSEAQKQFKKLGVEVVGISPDMPDKQKKFDEKKELGFPLLSDPDHKVAEAFGVWGEKKMYGKSFMGIVRSSFLVDEKGKIMASFYKVSPKDTVPKAMEALKG